ncbi:MAG: allophanate hydrolase [Salinisphaeraceae bacterium]|nr:allophanate hydrolase [Salinisphaeraceae bacterium]
MPNIDMTIKGLRDAYQTGQCTPEQVLRDIRARSCAMTEHNIWIHLLNEAELQPYLTALESKDPAMHPLWGIPFAIKDNIDLAGIPTTAACEAFAYTPDQSATVVQALINAGALPVGKTNMDQFATGLNGTRSPWGACKNAFNRDYISGGSSSGSAVAVALGLASFSLGTDTAGSGRVPAAFNNLVGLKPTRGLLSATGMVPACRSLDCMTIFALHCEDAQAVLSIAEGYDEADPYSRANHFENGPRTFGKRVGPLRMGIIPIEQLQFFGDSAYEQAYLQTLAALEHEEVEFVPIDYIPFDEAARLLYEGPWVAERYLATQPFIEDQPEAMHPVVRDIITGGSEPKATALFAAQYRLSALTQQCHAQLRNLDCLLTPTAGGCFTIDELLEEPIERNSQLGYYTNFMNLLDMSAVAMPTVMAKHGLPFGVTLAAPAWSDRALLSIAMRLESVFKLPLGANLSGTKAGNLAAVGDTKHIDVVVCGAHLEGLPLNWQLLERGATLKAKTHTAPVYRMFALAGRPPYRPGLILDEAKGNAIEVEVWSLPAAQFGSFVQGIPAPLGIGKVRLADGSQVSGFICEPYGINGAEEITHLGGWRPFMQQRS